MAAQSAAAAEKRRLPGSVVSTRVPGGWWSDASESRDAGRKCTGETACCFSARKRLLGRVTGDRYSAGVYNRYTAEHKHKLCLAESY